MSRYKHIMILNLELIAGTIAIVFSSMSSSEADNGSMKTAQSHSKLTRRLIIAAVITGIICYILIIIMLAIMWKAMPAPRPMFVVQGLGAGSVQMTTTPAPGFSPSQQVTQ